jgi:U2 small nuclear ribonucleoprotein A'
MGVKSLHPTIAASETTDASRSKLSRMKLTEVEKKRLQEMIKRAQSLDEIIRLETMLNEGRLPSGFQADEDDVMEE